MMYVCYACDGQIGNIPKPHVILFAQCQHAKSYWLSLEGKASHSNRYIPIS